LYSPGYYPGGIDIKGNVFAQFRSGIYWINLGGFQLESNSIVRMAQGADASDPTGVTTWPIGTTTAQMLVYNSGTGIFSISGNSGAFGSSNFPTADCPNGGNCLVGSPSGPGSTYSGILFFQNRATATTLNHSLQGGGGLTIQGTVYLTHTAASIQSDGKYQSLSLQGNSGGTTKVQGEIITDVLSLGGTADITMNLISTKTFQVRQVALVH
jgi:hypothetical protein